MSAALISRTDGGAARGSRRLPAIRNALLLRHAGKGQRRRPLKSAGWAPVTSALRTVGPAALDRVSGRRAERARRSSPGEREGSARTIAAAQANNENRLGLRRPPPRPAKRAATRAPPVQAKSDAVAIANPTAARKHRQMPRSPGVVRPRRLRRARAKARRCGDRPRHSSSQTDQRILDQLGNRASAIASLQASEIISPDNRS